METASNIATEKNKQVQNIFKQAASWFKKKIGPDKKESDPVVKKEPLQEMRTALENEFGHYKGNVELHEMEKDFLLSKLFMLDSGFTDGVNGIRQFPRSEDVTTLASGRAMNQYNFAQSVLKGKKVKAETEQTANKKLMKRYKRQDKQEHQYLEVLQYYKRYHPRTFDGLWSILCLFFGVLLVIADLPLAFKLLETGFDFDKPYHGWLTAGGIALCTVFIKIYFDSYIDTKYGNSLLIESRFTKMFNEALDDENTYTKEQCDTINNKEKSRKQYWYNSIFIFTLAGIITLGSFRMEAAKLAGNVPIPTNIYLSTFIFITLIFPIISGICFSIGLTGIQNIFRYRRTNRNCKVSREKFIQSLKNYTASQKEFKDIETELNKWEAEKSVDTYTTILLSYYDKGYKLGLAMPDYYHNENDLFKMAERWRRKAISRKINNSIIKVSEL